MKKTLTILATLLLLTVAANAATASGTLTVSASFESSVAMTFENATSNGVALSAGATTNTATLDLGTVSLYGPLPSNVVRTTAASTYSVATNFGVKVLGANYTNANYTLSAALNAADAVYGWAIDTVTLSTTSAPITATGTYGSTNDHTIKITIPNGQSAGTASAVINFVATPN